MRDDLEKSIEFAQEYLKNSKNSISFKNKLTKYLDRAKNLCSEWKIYESKFHEKSCKNTN